MAGRAAIARRQVRLSSELRRASDDAVDSFRVFCCRAILTLAVTHSTRIVVAGFPGLAAYRAGGTRPEPFRAGARRSGQLVLRRHFRHWRVHFRGPYRRGAAIAVELHVAGTRGRSLGIAGDTAGLIRLLRLSIQRHLQPGTARGVEHDQFRARPGTGKADYPALAAQALYLRRARLGI